MPNQMKMSPRSSGNPTNNHTLEGLGDAAGKGRDVVTLTGRRRRGTP
jgi:hypothetical protein